MPTASNPSQTLCQVAVALIPVLLFAGALLGRPDGASGHPKHKASDSPSQSGGVLEASGAASSGRLRGWAKAIMSRVSGKLTAIGIIVVIAVAMVAELFAIKGTFDVRPNVFEIRWVAGSLAIGTMAAGLSTCVPWAERVFKGEAKRRHLAYGAVSLAALGVAIWFSQFVALNSIDGASKIQTLNTAQSTDTSDFQAWQSFQTAVGSDRAALLSLLHGHSFETLPSRTHAPLSKSITVFAYGIDAAAASTSSVFIKFKHRKLANTNESVVLSLSGTHHSWYERRLERAIENLVSAENQANLALTDLHAAVVARRQACLAAARYEKCHFSG
jgi:hypothetical protein